MHALIAVATVIGFIVIFSWVVLSAWCIYTVIGELRFNRALKRRAERDFDILRSSWLLEMREEPSRYVDGAERTDTVAFSNVHHILDDEDHFDTEKFGLVFDIRERYPHEFAQHSQDRPEVHGR